MIERGVRTQEAYYRLDCQRVYDLSLEHLMGRTLGNALITSAMVTGRSGGMPTRFGTVPR
jgi:glucan phosphorylase